MADKVTLRIQPLFPVQEISRLASHRTLPPDPDQPRPGVALPITVIYDHLSGRPAAFIELDFKPDGDLPEPLSPEHWDAIRRRFELPPIENQDPAHPFSGGHRIEFGPFTIVRGPKALGLLLPTPEPAWETSVQRAGSCLVALGCGLGVTDDSFIVVPEGAAIFVATYGGSFPAPSLDDIPGLHVIPLTTDAYDPLAPSSFVIDSDVLIEIERFCITPSRKGDRVERIRHLLLNIAYRDLLPGLALAQVYQPGRRSTNVDAATRAAKAVQEVMDWDRARISTHDSPCQSFRPGFLEDFTGTASDARMLALYAGVLRLRRLWHPNAPLRDRVIAFETFVRWMRTDLRLASASLFQTAANLFISSSDAHNQASHLLHFVAGPVAEVSLDRLWGAAFDLLILGSYGEVSLEPDIVEPVLLTFDTGLAAMFKFLRHASFGSLVPEAGPDSPHGFFVASRLELNPKLSRLQPRIDDWRRELQEDARARAARGERISLRGEEMAALADGEERLLLGSS